MVVQFDAPLDELRSYHPALAEPTDFDDFWRKTLDDSRRDDLAATFTLVDAGLPLLNVYDVSFGGWNGDRVAAWLYLPRGTIDPLPTVIEYMGYTSGRGLVHEHLLWATAGYAHLVVDTRGQGSSAFGGVGATHDNPGLVGPHVPGFVTMGIEAPERYYYRRVFVDAVRAIEVTHAHPMLDSQRVIVTGTSQGGGISIAVAGLVSGLLGVMPDVPFLSHIRHATEITDSHPYREIAQYCSAHRDSIDNAFQTLSYFDGVHFSARATAPTLFSVALMDTVCPPSTVFAAYNNWGHPTKQMSVYPYNGHEGGGAFQRLDQLRFVAEL